GIGIGRVGNGNAFTGTWFGIGKYQLATHGIHADLTSQTVSTNVGVDLLLNGHRQIIQRGVVSRRNHNVIGRTGVTGGTGNLQTEFVVGLNNRRATVNAVIGQEAQRIQAVSAASVQTDLHRLPRNTGGIHTQLNTAGAILRGDYFRSCRSSESCQFGINSGCNVGGGLHTRSTEIGCAQRNIVIIGTGGNTEIQGIGTAEIQCRVGHSTGQTGKGTRIIGDHVQWRCGGGTGGGLSTRNAAEVSG